MRKIRTTKASSFLPLNQSNQPLYGRASCMDGSESFSSSSSFTSSYSDEGSDYASWEEYVAPDGKLFYVEFIPRSKKSELTAGDNKREEFSGKFLRLGHKPIVTKSKNTTSTRRQQQLLHEKQSRTSKQQELNKTESETSEQLYKFANISPHDVSAAKKMELVITAADRYRFGRRSTAVESILGFRVTPFPDQSECLMVLDFVHDMPTLQQAGHQIPVQRGDWFQSLDDIDIRASNINELLLQFKEPTKVCLKFHGPNTAATATGGNVEDNGANANSHSPDSKYRQLENFSQFTQAFMELLQKDHKVEDPQNDKTEKFVGFNEMFLSTATPPTTPILTNEVIPFALLILPPECCQLDEHKNSLYYYPEDSTNNFLYKTRGSFLTLNAVLSAELKTQPLHSTMLFDGEPYTIHFRRLEHFLVLFAYARRYTTVAEGTLRCDELIADMKFSFAKLTLENLQTRNDGEVRSATVPVDVHGGVHENVSLRTFLLDFCEVQRVRVLFNHQRYGVLFEELLRESRLLPLPKEAQLRIFDALSEMEAMDYRNWNDEPLHTHREFFIYGSALYCGHNLLVTHLPIALLASVEGFIRCRGIFDFIGEHTLKSLNLWQEINVTETLGTAAYKCDRFFLSICARGQLLLAVVLKMFNSPDVMQSVVVPPSLFYIEEIQETLDHLIQCGIESLAMFWAVTNKRPEVGQRFDALSETEDATKSGKEALSSGNNKEQASRLETFIKKRLHTSNSAASSGPSFEEDVLLCSSLGSSSVYSLSPSEEERNRQHVANLDTAACGDSDSGSDWEHFGDHNHDLKCNAAPVAMTESLYKEISNVLPVNITPGWRNSLYYYIYIDLANGTVLCPFKTEQFQWLCEVRSALHIIRGVFQRTKSACRQLQDTNTSSDESFQLFKNELSIIKEHSITLKVPESSDGVAITVRGRLFTGKEVYICHHPDVPQNMVEIAYRLSFFAAG